MSTDPDAALQVFTGGDARWWTPRGWVARLARFAGLVERQVEIDAVDHGADYASGGPVAPTYDPLSSMSAMSAFPWVYAAVMRASADLAGLPLQVVRGRGKAATVLDDHPLYRVMERPSPRVSGRQFRRQLYVDTRLTGNGITGVAGTRSAMALVRLHPKRVQIDPDRRTKWGDYIYDGAGQSQRWPAEDICHVRTPSWEDDPRGLWGTGAIQALNDDLTADRRAAKATASLSKRPRPDIIVSPADKDIIWNEKIRRAIKTRLDKLLDSGGTVVMSNGVKMDLPTWTPRDMEFPQLRELVVKAILAVTGVPPHMVGLPVANYAQAREQTLVYWEMLRSLALDISDALWTPLAGRFGSDLSVRHDFSAVDALQASRDARQQRAMTWIMMGMPAADAAAYEGFDDAPFPAAAPTAAPASPPISEEAIAATMRSLFPPPKPHVMKGGGAPSTSGDDLSKTGVKTASTLSDNVSADTWGALMAKAHTPNERRLWRSLAAFLRDQGERVAEGFLEQESAADVPLTRTHADTFEDIWDQVAEEMALSSATEADIRLALAAAFAAGSDALNLEMTWGDLDELAEAQTASMAALVTDTTAKAVRGALALGAGLALVEVAESIRALPVFAPARALTIARTETTASLTFGQQSAWMQAEVETGKTVKQVWLSAFAENTRDAHAEADGQTRALGEDFTLSTGASGPGPGLMGDPAEDINCLCSVRPELS